MVAAGAVAARSDDDRDERHLASQVREAGGRATLVPDAPVSRRYRAAREDDGVSSGGGALVRMMMSLFGRCLQLTGALPGVTFMMTGNPKDLSSELKANRPANVTLTGFLPDAAYAGLLTSADAVMTLTTRNHTMLRAAYEAIYQGTPVIVSDWPLLRSAFDEGAVHVENTSSAIAEGIRKMERDHAMYRAGAVRLQERKLKRWTTTLAELRATAAA